ncbi:exported hypothetical protein [Capnocytophaga canimorsus]|uniref:Lipoprotein n=1 Tax=Capnocytophaga canimorsus TaxID=28188 RepID=A0A0B7IG81_9FLAO|nr:hypothetical protein [Capnocytophaga canimorsus]CEN49002.1 exported hypothetical protein [Capnocytophaga canimorsus]
MKKSKNVLVVLCMALAFTACQKEDEQTFEKILDRLKSCGIFLIKVMKY